MPTLKKLLAPLLARFGVGRRSRESNPSRDWLLMLFIAFLGTLGGLGYGAYTFFRISEAVPATSVGSVGAPVALDPSRLEETVTHYRARTVRFEELRERPGEVPQLSESSAGTAPVQQAAERGEAPAPNVTEAPTPNP